jgi:hypothetical protein
LLRSFSPEQHSNAEIKAWIEGRANESMAEAGPFARKKILAEDLGHFKLAQACILNIFDFLFWSSFPLAF